MTFKVILHLNKPKTVNSTHTNYKHKDLLTSLFWRRPLTVWRVNDAQMFSAVSSNSQTTSTHSPPSCWLTERPLPAAVITTCKAPHVQKDIKDGGRGSLSDSCWDHHNTVSHLRQLQVAQQLPVAAMSEVRGCNYSLTAKRFAWVLTGLSASSDVLLSEFHSYTVRNKPTATLKFSLSVFTGQQQSPWMYQPNMSNSPSFIIFCHYCHYC